MHTTTRATPVQPVFGRDSILSVRHIADWKCTQSQKQDMIAKNNIEENGSRKQCTCELNKLVLIEQDWSSECGTTAHRGPCPITKMNDNGAVQVQMDKILDTVNVRQLKPCNTQEMHSSQWEHPQRSTRRHEGSNSCHATTQTDPNHGGECTSPKRLALFACNGD